jgi:hypothetical protein
MSGIDLVNKPQPIMESITQKQAQPWRLMQLRNVCYALMGVVLTMYPGWLWFERFVIIITALHRDYLPSSWAMFHPTLFDMGNFLSTFDLCLYRYSPVCQVFARAWLTSPRLKPF